MNDCARWNLVAAGPSREHLRPEHLLKGAPTVTVNRALDVVGQGIKVDFAAFADAPAGCWTPMNLERFLRIQPHIQIWAAMRYTPLKTTIKRRASWKQDVPRPRFLKAVRKAFPEATWTQLVELSKKYLMEPAEEFETEVPGPPTLHLWDRVLPIGTGIRELPHGSVADVNKPTQSRNAFTTLMALMKIFSFEPSYVRILCADMMGSWIEGKNEEECHAFEKEKVASKGGEVPLDRWRHEKAALERAIKSYKDAKGGLTVDFVRPEPLFAPV